MQDQLSFARAFQIPLDTLEIHFKRIGIMEGKGFDFLIESASVVYMVQDQQDRMLFVCQEYTNLSEKQIKVKLERLLLVGDHNYIPTYMKFVGWVQEEIVGKEGETQNIFQLLYDYQFVEYDLHTFADLRGKQGAPFSEEEVWELLHYLIISFAISGSETLEFTDVEPFSIYICKSPYIKYLFGNLNLRVPTAKWEENQFPCYYTDELLQGKRSLKSVENNFTYRLGLLVLYLLGGKPFKAFNQSILKDGKIEQNITAKINELKPLMTNEMNSLVEKCVVKHEDSRPKVKELLKTYELKLFGPGIEYYEGTINLDKLTLENFKGLVSQSQKGAQAQGVGKCDMLTGCFQKNEMFGIGMHNMGGILSYGEWHQNKLQAGMVHNKVKSYLFVGEFTDPKLSKAKGIRFYLSSKINDSQDTDLVEDGSFKNDVLLPPQPPSAVRQQQGTQQSQNDKTN